MFRMVKGKAISSQGIIKVSININIKCNINITFIIIYITYDKLYMYSFLLDTTQCINLLGKDILHRAMIFAWTR